MLSPSEQSEKMITPNLSKLFLFCFILFALISCSKSEAQRNFEEEALSPPAGITAMDANGTHPEGSENDPSDWQTAPNFSGLFEVVTPAFPNPVSYNGQFEILIDVKAIDAINGLSVYAFQQPSDLSTANQLVMREGWLEPGLQSIIIDPSLFANSSSTGTLGSTYRIIFYDRQQTVITYGDVLVQ